MAGSFGLEHRPPCRPRFARNPSLAQVWPAGPIRDRRVRAIAVTTPERVPSLPDVPTLKELGDDVDVATWYALIVPAGTPAAITQRLYAEYTRVAQLPEIHAFPAQQGLIYPPNAPGAFATRIAAETRRWGEIIRANNIQLD